ncbi:MAG TPA: hypothetical protein VKV36_00610 [Acidimicrobiales bacterium]|nr:hypothetical protein [Acidimicrobiales bacterium]
MPRRMDIELTSRAADGSWTWRAAGARQPKGSLAPGMVPGEVSVGDVVRAEVESGIEGIEIVAVLPPRPARGDEQRASLIEVLGSPRRAPDVSVVLAPGSRARERRPGDGLARRERPAFREARRAAPGAGRREGAPAGRREGAPAGRREARPAQDTGGARRGEVSRAAAREHRPSVSTVHRNAALAALRPEQLPVAEQLLRGGMPAVRRAIEEQVAAAKAAGSPLPAANALLAMAEELLPAVRLAEWKDRAASAQAAGRDLRLRELRAVVAASRTVTLDEEGRSMARSLQEVLDHRVNALRDEWLRRITKALDEGRVLDALRITSRAPEPGTRCPADLAVRLAEAGGAAMTADQPPERWLALLHAVVESPVRRTVKPEGIPDDPDVHAAARNAAGLVPELAKLLGLRLPPPPPARGALERRQAGAVPGRQGPPRGTPAPGARSPGAGVPPERGQPAPALEPDQPAGPAAEEPAPAEPPPPSGGIRAGGDTGVARPAAVDAEREISAVGDGGRAAES